MRLKMTRAEHTEHVEITVVGIILANVAHMRWFLRSETSHHALCDRLLRGSSWGSLVGAITAFTLAWLAKTRHRGEIAVFDTCSMGLAMVSSAHCCCYFCRWL